MLTEIETKLIPIANELENKRLKVPKYQRSYSWEEKQVREFLTDISEVIAKKGSEYFLGSIVISRSNDDDGRLEIVDGQQRLATTIFLVAAIRNLLWGMKEKRKGDEVEKIILKMVLRTEEIEPQMLLNDDDNNFYLRKILKNDRLAEPTKPSHHKIQQAFDFILEYLRKTIRKSRTRTEKSSYLIDWIEFIKNSAKVIEISVPDHSNAFIVFETLNDRGLDLSIGDLLKNHIFLTAGQRITEAQESWGNLNGLLQKDDENSDLIGFIRHYWSSNFGPVRERDVYSEIKKKVSTPDGAIKLCEDFYKSAKIYSDILSGGGVETEKFGNGFREALSVLSMFGMSQVRPLLIAGLELMPEKEIPSVCRILISSVVRLVVVGRLGGGTLESKYSETAIKIRKKKIKGHVDLAKEMATYVPNDVEFKSAFSGLVVPKSKVARYYLRKLELANDKKQEFIPNPDADKVNLEHILPKSNKTTAWIHLTDEERDGNRYRLGNLCLMDKATNGKGGNDGFSVKVKDYQISKFTLTKGIKSPSGKWNVDDISKRQSELADLALLVWNMK